MFTQKMLFNFFLLDLDKSGRIPLIQVQCSSAATLGIYIDQDICARWYYSTYHTLSEYGSTKDRWPGLFFLKFKEGIKVT